ncbi:MAG: LysR family transcriptional regulator, partial [Desulfobacterales bacterium]
FACNFSAAEIAGKLNMSPSTVSKYICRGQSGEMSKKLERDLFDWSIGEVVALIEYVAGAFRTDKSVFIKSDH